MGLSLDQHYLLRYRQPGRISDPPQEHRQPGYAGLLCLGMKRMHAAKDHRRLVLSAAKPNIRQLGLHAELWKRKHRRSIDLRSGCWASLCSTQPTRTESNEKPGIGRAFCVLEFRVCGR